MEETKGLYNNIVQRGYSCMGYDYLQSCLPVVYITVAEVSRRTLASFISLPMNVFRTQITHWRPKYTVEKRAFMTNLAG